MSEEEDDSYSEEQDQNSGDKQDKEIKVKFFFLWLSIKLKNSIFPNDCFFLPKCHI